MEKKVKRVLNEREKTVKQVTMKDKSMLKERENSKIGHNER